MLLVVAFVAKAEVIVDEQQRSYVMDGSGYPELAKQLETHRAPQADGDSARSHGLTEVGIETRYELHPRADGRCGLAHIQVRIHLIQTLPEWKPARPPSDETLAARVGQMLLGLRLHETGHRRHALMAAASIDRKLAALSVAESCARARRAADRVVARELLKLQIDEQRYDQATDSGRKQGAVLQMQRDLPHRRETMCDRRVGCPER